MKNFFAILLLFIASKVSYSQCSVTPTYTATVINCDDSVTISYQGIADYALNNDFNDGTAGTGWTATSAADFSNPYDANPNNPGNATPNTYLWMGSSAFVPRTLASQPLDLSGGGVICFDLVYSVQSGSSPTEGPDEPDEGVSLQYSIDGGTTWIDIVYFIPNGTSTDATYNTPGLLVSNPGTGSGYPGTSGTTQFTSWATYCFPIPLGAETTTTNVRWIQEDGSSANNDHWGLDNIQIQIADSTFQFYDAYTGNLINQDSLVVYPTEDSVVSIMYSNLIDDSCFADIPITVNPTDAGPDIYACEGLGHALSVTGISPWSNVLWTPSAFLDDPTSHTPYSNPVAPPQSVTYAVTSNCGTDSVTIFLVDSFAIEINQPDTICIGGDIQFTATASPTTPIATYEWGPDFLLNVTDQQSVIATPPTTSDFYVTATSVAGCVRTDTMTAYVDNVTLNIDIQPTNPSVCIGDSIDLYMEVLPPTDDYLVAQVPYIVKDTSTKTTINFTSENNTQVINLGFNFDFFGTTYTSISVCSNGWLSFTNSGLTTFTNVAIPNAVNPNNMVAFAWDDLDIPNGGTAEYYVLGSAPNRQFVLEFTNVVFDNTNNGSVTVQVVLYEQNGVIEINNINIDNQSASTITQGIENSTGTVGYSIPGSNNVGFSSSNVSYQFIPNVIPTNVSYEWSPNYNITNIVGDTVTVYPLRTQTYEVIGTASSCQSSALREVYLDTFKVNATPEIDTICPGGDLAITTEVLGANLTCELDYFNFEIPYYEENDTETPIVFSDYDEGFSQYIPLPFPFEFYCQTYDTVSLSTNGFLTFDIPPINSTNVTSVISNIAPFNFIALMWDDLVDSTSASSYYTTGTAPNRKFVINVDLVHKGGTVNNNRVKGQIILYETTNIIDINCETCQNSEGTALAVQGIKPLSAGKATPGRDRSNWEAFNDAQRFYPQSSLNTQYTISWTPTTNVSGDDMQAPILSPTVDTEYTVEIINQNGCAHYDTVNVYMKDDYTVTASNDTTLCSGESAFLNAVASEDFSTYSWTPLDGSLSDSSIANPTATPSATTSYLVEANYSTCVAYDTVLVGINQFVVDSVTVVDEICVQNSGSITIHASGTTLGLQYSIDGGTPQSSNTFTGLSGGTYTISVGAVNCDTTFSVNVVGGAALMSFDSINAVNLVCGNPGSIDIYVSGGTSPLSYSIDGGTTSSTTTYYSNLIAGTYNVYVEDSFGCNLDSTIVLTETLALGVNIQNQEDVSCYGLADGEVTFTSINGLAPINQSLDGINFVPTTTFTSLDTGLYTAYVQDANGCMDSTTFTIAQPDTFDVQITVPGNVLCAGGTIDSLTATTTGGNTGTISYLWNTTEVTSSIQNIAFGTYWVQTQDVNNCTASDTVIISQPVPLYLEISADSSLCGNQNSGIAYIDSVSGGTPNYTYQWYGNTVGNVAGNDTALNLFADFYTLTVTDFNGCTITDTVTVFEPSPVIINFNTTDISCYGDTDGSVDATITGGSPAYTYSWNTSDVSEDITNQGAGWKILTVTDAKSCVYVDSVELTEPTALALSVTSTNVTCKDLNDGTATVTVNGGTPNYSYAWNGGNSANNATTTGLDVGVYQVVVTDDNGCVDSISTSAITEPDSLLLTTDNITNVSCNAGNDGAIQVSTNGGTTNYTYSWTNGGGNNEDLSNATAGNYTLTVTDANNCSYQLSETITEPTAISISLVGTDVDCFGASTGSIAATVSGGTIASNYSFAWTGPNGFSANTEDISNLEAGTYTLTVTDDNNCTLNESIQIDEPAVVEIGFSSTAVNCYGGSDGTLTASVTVGGTAPFTYQWDAAANNQGSATATNLSEGNYTVTVTDDNGCTYSDNSDVTQPNTPLTITLDSVNITCAGYDNGEVSVTAQGGTPGYTYLWNDIQAQTNATATNLAPGVYEVTVTDDNNCTETGSISITEPNAIGIDSIVVDSANCWGDATGTLSVYANGGTTLGYLYSIDGGLNFQNDPNFYNLDAGNYDEIVIQDLGSTEECLSPYFSTTIFEPDYFIVNVNPADTTLQLEESLQLELVVDSPYTSNDIAEVTWHPTTGLNCTDCIDPTVLTYEHYTEYTATINYYGDDNELCNASAATVIVVENNLQLFIPNAFTPSNFDETNNVFEVYGEGIETILLQVFNRWGEKIFESDNQNFGWDGTYQGVLQNPGVYTYFVDIEYLDGKEISKKGSVTLIR